MRGNNDGAGMLYRRVLDIATKELDPSLAGKWLAQRLRDLTAAKRLTPDISDWASRIKALGDEAAHEEDEPTSAEVADMANLTRMALVYLFEMPKKIADMRTPAASGGAKGTA